MKETYLWHMAEANETQPTEAISHLECKLNRLTLTLCPSAPLEPLDKVLQQYTDTLCTAQKKTSFVNTLLQDIIIFNGNNSSQLEDWLIDIKTASNLTSKSRTTLAQAKSKGFIPTLISKALCSDKSWDEIKDLFHLKFCNLDIHTSVSCFMEIQQKERESLPAYIHRFKREADRCNFNNNAATIRIFIKWLRNAHTLATQVHKKGPQTLADAIREVEKLQAAQQLTATLLPSSTVNVMLSEDDKCFQYQELGHMACHCPKIRCFICDEYGHAATDCSDKIPPSGTPAHHRKHHSRMRCQTRSSSRHHHRVRHRFSRSRSHLCTHRYRSHIEITHREVTPGHITNVTTEAHHATDIQVLIITDGTHHIGGLPHIEAPLHILETAVGLDHILHTKLVKQHLLNLHTALTRTAWNTRIKNIKRSSLMNSHLITTVLMNHPVIQKRI